FMFFISLVFSVLVLCNYEILWHGETMDVLREMDPQMMDSLLMIILVILVCFIIFFTWYSTNIFLMKRKKEIGVYLFMGIELNVISRLYFLETMLLGIFSCVVGESLACLLSKFFQMLVLKVAGFELQVAYDVTMQSLIETFIIFMIIFFVLTVKGMISIARSQIIELLKANVQEEKVLNLGAWYYIEALLSFGLLCYGYGASQQAGMNSTYIVPAVISVLIGTYGLYQSLLPIIFKALSKNKAFLYRGENIITINNLTYRLRRNYRAYAMISITIACTVCVLGASFTMKYLYDNQKKQMLLYPVVALSTEELSLSNESVKNEVELLAMSDGVSSNGFLSATDVILMKESDFIQTVTQNGEEAKLSSLKVDLTDSEMIVIERPGTLMSIEWDPVTEYYIQDQTYEIVGNSRILTLGWSINNSVAIVNDKVYDSFVKSGQILYFYGIDAESEEVAHQLVEELNVNLNNETTVIYNGYLMLDSINWLKFTYAIGAFLFLVVMMATGSIIYMKIYHDAAEDKNKYQVLLKIGAMKEEIGCAIAKEVILFYVIPLMVGAVHSYFAIGALGDLMKQDLTMTFYIALGTCMIIFAILCVWSIQSFKRIIFK
ncbi:MAG: hypothetical protein K2G70_06150, partial [Turicibacter sp.]|nr:hypothetical protein [Turicibacter sp.]